MTRGLLLIDVDGPLNPYAEKGHKRDRLPLPYKTFRLRPKGLPLTANPLRVWLSERHGPMICRFAVEHGLEPVWATTWEHEANRWIGPEIGLPELPVIEFGFDQRNIKGWKYPRVYEYAGDRPLVWFDDDFQTAAFRVARETFEANREGTPTLLHHVDPRLGLTELDFSAAGRTIREW